MKVGVSSEVRLYGLTDADVVKAVAKAMEVLSANGAKAIDYAADSAGWIDLAGVDGLAALDLWQAVLALPAEQNLALMWRVMRDDLRHGESVLNDLVCFVAHHAKGAEKFGREGLRYWVRHWARGDGSRREAAMLYGSSDKTHERFYRDVVRFCLDSWFIAAKGALEVVVLLHFGRYLEAA